MFLFHCPQGATFFSVLFGTNTYFKTKYQLNQLEQFTGQSVKTWLVSVQLPDPQGRTTSRFLSTVHNNVNTAGGFAVVPTLDRMSWIHSRRHPGISSSSSSHSTPCHFPTTSTASLSKPPPEPEEAQQLTGAHPPADQFPQHAGRQTGRQTDSQVLLQLSVVLTSFSPVEERDEGRQRGSPAPSLPRQAACASTRSSSSSSASLQQTRTLSGPGWRKRKGGREGVDQ